MSIKPKSTVTLRANAHCPSHSKSDVHIRDLQFLIDEPIERGGTNSGPTPTDTAISALIGCTNVIGHKCAAKMGIDIGHLDIQAACEFERAGVTLQSEVEVPFKKIELVIQCSGSASQSELEELAREVAKFCPLSKLFRNSGTTINETWQPKTA